MVLETSALVAIFLDEPEGVGFLDEIARAAVTRLSVASFVEASIVLQARFGAEAVRRLDLLLTRAGIEIVPVSTAQGVAARDAFARYGKGRHPAGLDFGDCFARTPSRKTSTNPSCSRAPTSRRPTSSPGPSTGRMAAP